jgi:hypothetical protein
VRGDRMRIERKDHHRDRSEDGLVELIDVD